MNDSLRAAIDRTKRVVVARAYECEVRLGIRVSSSGARATDSNGPVIGFNSNVSSRLFYATFQALYSFDSASISDEERSSILIYDGVDARCERRAGARDRWVDKHTVRRPDDWSRPEWWFDVRIAESLELELDDTPDRVRYVRAKAELVSPTARQTNALTAEATPRMMRDRRRRSVTFSDAAAWRIDFTIISQHDRVIQHDNGMPEAVLHSRRNDAHEIELELVDPTPTSDELTRQCVLALERVAWALGSTRQVITERLRTDMMAAEMQATLN